MQDVAQAFALVFAGMALGWTAMFSFLAAPMAFRDLDAGRANRFVRNAMKDGHPAIASLAGLGAVAAALASSIAGAAVLAVTAALYLLARLALLPQGDLPEAKNVRRRLKTGRVVAASLTAILMVALVIASGLVALRI